MILTLLALQAPPADSAATPHIVTIPRLEAAAQIDGRLDEAAWGEAARLGGFHQFQPVDGRPAEERTEVYTWYAPGAIYFGIVAYDRDPASIHATVADRDNIENDDFVTLYLDTFNDRRRAFFFGVNPLGSQEDGVRSEGVFTAGTLFGGSIDYSPDYLWQSKGQVTDSGYVVEIRIPFKSLRYPGSGEQSWGLNVMRHVQRTGYDDTWTDTRRANASFLLQAGMLTGLHDLQRGIVTEVQPFVTAQANGTRTGSSFDREAIQPSAGVNLRLGLTSNLSIDATYNPDFSQIESDVSLVTVNERFALFFPEKRPFFLEGIELFSTPNQLVYTREVVDPVAGGKVTAKLGPYNVAHLTAVDDRPGKDALFNVTRVRRDLGTNSTTGITITNRDQAGGYNRVVAADARIVFAKLYYVAGQLGQSWTRDMGAVTTRHAPLWEGEFDRTGRAWGFNYKLTGIGDGFESQAGFVPRNHIVTGHAFNRLSWYGGRGAFIENFTTFFGPTRTWLYRDFLSRGSLEGSESADFNFSLRGGWRASAHGEHDLINFEPGAYQNYSVDQGTDTALYSAPAGYNNGFSFFASVTTPAWQSLGAFLKVTRSRGAIFDEGSQGYETRVEGDLDLRPTGSVRISASNTYARITRRRDGSEFSRTIIPRLKLEYQPFRALFFRVVGEYVAERRAALEAAVTGQPLLVGGSVAAAAESNRLRLDWLASFEPVPGTVAFFGYGASLDESSTLRFSHLSRESDGFFVKLAYQIRK